MNISGVSNKSLFADRHDELVQCLQKLIPVLKEKGLIGPVLPASTVTALARNHKSRVPFMLKGRELAERIMDCERLVVDGIDVSASVYKDSVTSKTTCCIQFLWSDNCNLAIIRKKPDQELALQEQITKEKWDRQCRRIEKQRNDGADDYSNPAILRPDTFHFEGDEELMKALRRAMGKEIIIDEATYNKSE
jgi:hypothetical protein